MLTNLHRILRPTSNKLIYYIISILLSAVYSSLLIILFPNVSLTFKMISNLLMTVFLTRVFLKCIIFNSLLSVILSVVILGISDVVAEVTYLLPLKLSVESYETNFLHITIGSIIMFITALCFLKLFGQKLIKIRDYALTYNYNLMIVLSADLTAVLLLLLISENIFVYFLKNGKAFYGESHIALNMILMVLVLVTIIIVTIYFLNNSILNKLKLEQAMNYYYRDDLTGVLNRKAGIALLKQHLKLSKQKRQSITLCYIDINNLKVVNDTYGHKQGDQLIVSVINAIKENIRKTDNITRLGGDEFMIIFPDYNIKEAEVITKRVLNQLENTKWELDDGYTISFSYGLAESNGETYETDESLIEKADNQMYQYKRLYHSAEHEVPSL